METDVNEVILSLTRQIADLSFRLAVSEAKINELKKKEEEA